MARDRKLIIGGLIGNVMTFFDFMVYVYLSKYIEAIFFSGRDPFVSKIFIYSIFACGYLARPLGAMLFGHIGDKYGRKTALIQSIILMIIATASIGLLPTDKKLGLISGALLVLCRFAQGVAVSGEQGGIAVYLGESLGLAKKGFTGSLVLASSFVGMLFGLVTCSIVSSCLPEQEMFRYGWRIPFLLSVLLGLVSFFNRISCPEPLAFRKAQADNQLSNAPLKEAFTKQGRKIVLMIFLMMGLSVPMHLYTIYIPNYLAEMPSFGSEQGRVLSMLGLAFISIVILVVGRVVDRVGHEKLLFLALSLSFLLACPVFYLLSLGTPFSIVCGFLILGVIVSLIAAPMFGVLLKAFPIALRYTTVSWVFNLNMALFGGAVPLVFMALVQYFGEKTFPSVYLALSGMTSIIALYCSCYSNMTAKKRFFLRSVGV